MPIQILSEETINQIAAGEVIERPLSIVKELLENAIDAGAGRISVEVREGGRSLIRITDNGRGIPKEEVRKAFLRHATSKIRDARDLFSLETLGFRGEALASIAAVSRVEMITKQEDTLLAVNYQIEGGVETSFSEVGAPEGTTVLVRDLFYNVPARRKFLKSRQTEDSRIQDILEMEALAHPEISFRYLQEGKERLLTLGNGNVRDVIYAIYGSEIASELLPVTGHYLTSSLTGLPKLHIRGFLGKPVLNRASRSFEIYFVNGRYVKNPMLGKAIEDGYRAFLMQHKFPFTVLFLDLSPELVDVNVHPQKMEVRFSDGNSVYEAMVDAIERTMHETELIVDVREREMEKAEKLPHIEPFEKLREQRYFPESFPKDTEKAVPSPPEKGTGFPEISGIDLQEKLGSYEGGKAEAGRTALKASGYQLSDFLSPEETDSTGASPGIGSDFSGGKAEDRRAEASAGETALPESPEQGSLFSERFLSEKARESHRIIGQVFRTYWLVEYEDRLFIMDQHAAHEKVNFERFMRQHREHSIVSQNLMPPILLTLTAREEDMLQKHEEAFREMGFDIASVGKRDYSLSAVPALLPDISKKELFLEMLDALLEESSMRTSDTIYYRIATMSCKAAVKGNMSMSFREAEALISELMALENPYACPHGRPTLISFSRTELEKKFKRIV